MSDFKTGLLLESVQREAWWGRYTWLENLQNPSIENLKAAQNKVLANQEANLNKKCQAVNTFLNKIKGYNTANLEENTERIVDDAIGQRLMKLINAGLNHERYSEDSILKEGMNDKTQREQAIRNLEEMNTLLRGITSSGKTNEQQLNKFMSLMKRAYDSASYWDATTREYVRKKAAAAEYATAVAINQHPDWKAIVTGNWVDEKGRQLVEDILVFDDKTLTLYGNIPIKVRITTRQGKTEVRTKKLKDVLEIKGTVRLASNEDYKKIQQLKLFSAQVKSGIDQNIFTGAQRNAISLAEIGGFGKANAIYGLYVEDIGRSDARWFKNTQEQNSESLNIFANMQLSQNILKTVLSKNEIYFTTEGFTTAREWLIKKNRYVTFKDRITQLSVGMMSEPRAITIVS
jgi:hypothetical protein